MSHVWCLKSRLITSKWSLFLRIQRNILYPIVYRISILLLLCTVLVIVVMLDAFYMLTFWDDNGRYRWFFVCRDHRGCWLYKLWWHEESCEFIFNLLFSFSNFLCKLQFVATLLLQIRKLDDSEFRNAFSRAFVRVWSCVSFT